MAPNNSEAVERKSPLKDLSLSASGLAFECFANEPQRTRSPIRSYTIQVLHTITVSIDQRVVTKEHKKPMRSETNSSECPSQNFSHFPIGLAEKVARCF